MWTFFVARGYPRFTETHDCLPPACQLASLSYLYVSLFRLASIWSTTRER